MNFYNCEFFVSTDILCNPLSIKKYASCLFSEMVECVRIVYFPMKNQLPTPVLFYETNSTMDHHLTSQFPVQHTKMELMHRNFNQLFHTGFHRPIGLWASF